MMGALWAASFRDTAVISGDLERLATRTAQILVVRAGSAVTGIRPRGSRILRTRIAMSA
jgi:hypothetical protein